MEKTFLRTDGRKCNQIRKVSVQYDVLGYADSSVFFEQGQTKVLVSVSMQQNVPPFLKGQRVGWLAAEYSMLPCSTHQRSQRESNQAQRNSRNVEISRLIGRCLRSVVALEKIGERTIIVDCDVLQADGGTRVACITAASIALKRAVEKWLSSGFLRENIFKESIAALSAGMVDGCVCVDLKYDEDSKADVDFNFVVTRSGDIIELQGTAEKTPVSWQTFEQIKDLALEGIKEVFAVSENIVTSSNAEDFSKQHSKPNSNPMFSLANRLGKM
jgi:ribonuclease PH